MYFCVSDELQRVLLGAFPPRNRSFSTSTWRAGIFGSSSTSEPAADQDHPLTPFQSRIAALETDALSHPEDVGKQELLLKELLEGGEAGGVIKYYEAIALSETGRSKALLGSEEALSIYLTALGTVGRARDVFRAVRRRDALLAGGSAPALPATPPDTSPIATPTTPAVSAAPATSTPLSSLFTRPSATGGNTDAPASNLNTQPGSPLSPIYVQMAPATPQASAARGLRWLVGMLFWGFLILTILSMVMENTGLLKAGPGPAEFEPEEGKVVKFSDVHGVEEAKAVRYILFKSLMSRNWKRLSNSLRTRRSFRLLEANCQKVFC